MQNGSRQNVCTYVFLSFVWLHMCVGKVVVNEVNDVQDERMSMKSRYTVYYNDGVLNEIDEKRKRWNIWPQKRDSSGYL